jgi:hypothetical protein
VLLLDEAVAGRLEGVAGVVAGEGFGDGYEREPIERA